MPAVGSVPAQGLTLDEFRVELHERFAEKIEGIEVMPVLTDRAPRYVYVLGEVRVAGPLHAGSAHHGDASHRDGRQLDRSAPTSRTSSCFAAPTTGG